MADDTQSVEPEEEPVEPPPDPSTFPPDSGKSDEIPADAV